MENYVKIFETLNCHTIIDNVSAAVSPFYAFTYGRVFYSVNMRFFLSISEIMKLYQVKTCL